VLFVSDRKRRIIAATAHPHTNAIHTYTNTDKAQGQGHEGLPTSLAAQPPTPQASKSNHHAASSRASSSRTLEDNVVLYHHHQGGTSSPIRVARSSPSFASRPSLQQERYGEASLRAFSSDNLLSLTPCSTSSTLLRCPFPCLVLL